MANSQEMIIRILADKARELHNKPRYTVPFSNIAESDALLNNIEEYPHFFVLGCIMDRQIPAEKAWNIPYEISKICGGTGFSNFATLNLDSLKAIFNEKKLHRFNDQMGTNFFCAIQKIKSEYGAVASRIWTDDSPPCSEVIERFADFPGVGQKISTMATNILVREFKVPLRNQNEIDISVDSQIEKVFKRIGFVPENASKQQIIEAARKIYPEYPGLIDSVVWELGRQWCKSDFSLCYKCFLNDYCPKNRNSEDDVSLPSQRRQRKSSKTSSRTSTSIKEDKFRARFSEVIKTYDTMRFDTCQIRFTSSHNNCIIKNNQFPAGIHYEFDDWENQISVELILNRSKISNAHSITETISRHTFTGLPHPIFTDQGNYWRVQFFFAETTPVDEIGQAMNRLISQAEPLLNQ